MGFIEGLASIGSSIGPSLTGAATAVESGAAGAASVAPVLGGLGRLGEAGGLGIVNEGPVGLAALKLTVPLGEIKFNNEPLPAPSVPLETEPAFFQAQKPAIFSPIDMNPFSVTLSSFSVTLNEVKGITPDIYPSLVAQDDKLVEPMVMPFALPYIASKIVEFPKPEAGASPALQPAVQIGPQTRDGVTNEVEPATAPQPVLREQVVEETVIERIIAKQIDTVEEETEESKLKNVVDKEVLGNRVAGLMGAAEVVGAKNEIGEIEGNKIVVLSPHETEDKRSGLIKKQGPDGSWVETLEEISSRKFSSLAEAKKQIFEIIARKVPVKKAKEGIEVGYEAVVRVLKYFFGKPKPVEQMITREVKKKRVLAKEGQKPSLSESSKPKTKEPRIVDFPALSEAFPKAA